MSKLQSWPISLPPSPPQGNNNNVNNVVLFHNNNVESSLIIPPPMGELRSSPSPNLPYVSSSSSDPDTPNSSSSSTPPAPPLPSHTLVQPTRHKKHRHKTRVFRAFRSVICSFPTASCKFPTLPVDGAASFHRSSFPGSGGSKKITGTLFGYRKGRVSLSFQESSKCLPSVVIELAIQTSALQREMSAGMVRIALECEKRPEKEKVRLLQEPLWSMFCNGKKTGFGVRREPTEEDLAVMELLKAVSMGVGVLPIGSSDVEGNDGELAYFRAQFEHMVGSKDSETFYMLSPEANAEPELTVFFVRL